MRSYQPTAGLTNLQQRRVDQLRALCLTKMNDTRKLAGRVGLLGSGIGGPQAVVASGKVQVDWVAKHWLNSSLNLEYGFAGYLQ